MGKFGKSSPKPHVVWSNDEGMLVMLHQKAGYMSRQEQDAKPDKLVRKYVDKSGNARRAGIPAKLRASQNLDIVYLLFVLIVAGSSYLSLFLRSGTHHH